jgi:hypothetical protein
LQFLGDGLGGFGFAAAGLSGDRDGVSLGMNHDFRHDLLHDPFGRLPMMFFYNDDIADHNEFSLGLGPAQKIISPFMHPGFRPSLPALKGAKSSKELAIPPVLRP